ncbi:MAG: PepSY-associated TM helix domain-containing protein [Phenylobacterium sp.]|uniref:PepSY-associated TM helix domain-containing protein n=1 Tax=Phenylobacterium sp. TaxID=1871053 RepID=UPI00391D5FA2
MTVSRAGRLRRLWLDVHLWIGVGLLVAFIPLGLTGSVLVWHDGLDRALHAERYAVSGPDAALTPAAYAEAARTAFGENATLSQLRMPAEPGDPVVAVGRLKGVSGPGGRPRNLNVWIDPPTGKVLAMADTSRSFVQLMHRMHGSLLIPEIGRKVVGWLGWAMFVSCATGLWLWWPRNNAVIKALRWRRGPSTVFNLHHMVGFWICIPLAVLSLTGVYISFPQTSRAVFGVAEAPRPGGPAGARGPGGPGGGRFAPPLERTELTLAEAAQAALAKAPGAEISTISLPTRGREPAWRVQLSAPGEERPVTVEVSDATGAAKVSPERAGGGPDPLSRWMRRIHDGVDMGLIWQTVIFLGGVAPALLGVTGLIMWLQRRAQRQAMARRLAEA